MATTKCALCGCVHIVPMFDGDESETVTCMACKGRFVIGRRDAKSKEEHWPSKQHRSMYRDEPTS